jgi:glycopeptide antibiotics resistance protein
MQRRHLLKGALGAYILFVLVLALCCFPSAKPVPNLVPFRSIIADWKIGGWPFVVDFVGNVIAFVPMGFVPPLIRRRPTRAWQLAVFGLALSLTIELGQYLSGRRVADVDDLILNTAGTILGYGCFAVFCRAHRRARTIRTSTLTRTS